MHWILHHLAITTGIFVVLALIIAAAVFRFLRHAYPHESRPQFETALVTLAVTVLFSVILNHLYAEKRQLESRLWALQDQHFSQLRQVLHSESEAFHGLAEQLKREGHVSDYRKSSDAGRVELEAAMWRDVASPDIKAHFPEYETLKQSLAREIESQDDEFRSAIVRVKSQVKGPHLDQQWREIDALSYVQQCLGHGDGVRMILSNSGYSFSYYGASTGGSGDVSNPPRPSPDQVAAFEAYREFKPGADVLSFCESSKHGIREIVDHAEQLSKKALLLADRTVLPGDCEFIKLESF